MTSNAQDQRAIDTPDYEPEPAGRVDAIVARAHDAAANARETVSDAVNDAGSKLGGAYEQTRGVVADGYVAALDKASAAYGTALERGTTAYGVARDGVSTAYEAARAQSAAALEKARDGMSQAKETTVQGIEENPFAALIGGIALGAALGALLPRSQREADLLAPVGEKLNDAARGAIGAAKAAGLAKLDELGISGDAAKAGIQKLVSAAGETARSAGQAAAASVRESKS